jgi:hypothetical protein
MAEPGAVAGVERHGRPRDPGNDAVDDGRFPPGTDPGVVQDILAGSIGSVLLQHEEEMTREQIERRLRMLLHHIGYRPDTSDGHRSESV